jgi:serine/threonine-protein kinase
MHEWLNLLDNSRNFILIKTAQGFEISCQRCLLTESTPSPTPSRKQGEVPDELERSSDVEVDYSNLENLLKANKWREADEETARLMLKVAGTEKQGWLNVEDIGNFPCTDLRTINQLWVKHSHGHFGFSVQKRIWLECGGKVDYETQCMLGDRVGWRKNGTWVTHRELDFSLNAPRAHFPTLQWGVDTGGRFSTIRANAAWNWEVYGFGTGGVGASCCGAFFSRVQTCQL